MSDVAKMNGGQLLQDAGVIDLTCYEFKGNGTGISATYNNANGKEGWVSIIPDNCNGGYEIGVKETGRDEKPRITRGLTFAEAIHIAERAIHPEKDLSKTIYVQEINENKKEIPKNPAEDFARYLIAYQAGVEILIEAEKRARAVMTV